jgi:CHAT domain-containing protein/Flp pilus assembly protein TadD
MQREVEYILMRFFSGYRHGLVFRGSGLGERIPRVLQGFVEMRVALAALVLVLIPVCSSLSDAAAQVPLRDDLNAPRPIVSPPSSLDWRATWQVEINQAYALYDAGHYAESAKAAEAALKLVETKGDSAGIEAITTLNALGENYRRLMRYDDAEKALMRAKATYDGRPDGYMGSLLDLTLTNIATLYFDEGRYSDAIPLLNNSITYLTTANGSELDIANRFNTLAASLQRLGMFGEAEAAYQRSIAIRENSRQPAPLLIAQSYDNLGALYVTLGRYNEAERLATTALEMRRKAVNADKRPVAISLENLAVLFRYQGRYGEAETNYRNALDVYKSIREDSPDVGSTLANMADLFIIEGRFAEAEAAVLAALPVLERQLPAANSNSATLHPPHPELMRALNVYAVVLERQHRYPDAIAIHRRVLDLRIKSLPPDHPDIGESLVNLGELLALDGQYSEASPYLEQAVSIAKRKANGQHQDAIFYLNVLARLRRSMGDPVGAAALLEEALKIQETSATLNDLARLAEDSGDFDKAEMYYFHALRIWNQGGNHSDLGTIQTNLADMYIRQHKMESAYFYLKLAVDSFVRRDRLNHDQAARVAAWDARGEVQDIAERFASLLKTERRLDAGKKFSETSFELAQLARISKASTAISQMASRSARRDPELERMVKERQDLEGEWQILQNHLIEVRSQALNTRNISTETDWTKRLDQISARAAEIDQILRARFSDYAKFVFPEPLSVAEVQHELAEDTALVLFFDTPKMSFDSEETLVWVVTKHDASWNSVPLGTEGLKERVQALRCGLDRDPAVWRDMESIDRCQKLLGSEARIGDDGSLPFSFAAAYELYDQLLRPFESLLAGKRLLLVPSGALTSLPFQVLVTAKPRIPLSRKYNDFKGVSWLGRSSPLTVLPSVSSLQALTQFARQSQAEKAYLGYGDPVLRGNAACPPKGEVPHTCVSPQQPATSPDLAQVSVAGAPSMDQIYRGGASREKIIAAVRDACPLPETAYELRCIAERIGLSQSELRLGKDATEADIKEMSRDQKLKDFRILHFATHGLLAGETARLTKLRREPAIMMTPPDDLASTDPDDDGLLTASEISQLNLDADWVVLSACNTAAGDASDAEPLAGLARAFFYAGARSLLVSHWPVPSVITVRLLNGTFSKLYESNSLTHAEAVRLAMIDLMDGNDIEAIHPSAWAPFSVIDSR